MRLRIGLILILGGVSLFCFQNFDFADYKGLEEKKFSSTSTDPLQRLGDYLEFQVSDEMKEHLHSFEGEFQWNSNSDSNDGIDSFDDGTVKSEASVGGTKNKIRYGLLNINTYRIQDEKNQVNCRIEGGGVNLQWQRQISSTSSYVIEHNTGENKSQAKIQFSW